ncbi:cytochrome P450 [Phanerochaete sordida]|uniref:Cytochrome P450 n=1 Tax=Phanerochaete sordida TaxID=48140 RepID=A0A9P3GJR6_9APHY|nr:cytochrome P450 [Phanerochaete sordida]
MRTLEKWWLRDSSVVCPCYFTARYSTVRPPSAVRPAQRVTVSTSSVRYGHGSVRAYLERGLQISQGVLVSRRSSKTCRYPPGPTALPLVGNLFDVPAEDSWLTFIEWSRRYGSDIIHFEVLGQHFVVLNSAQVCKDLFDKRSQIYSDRQQTVMAQELTGWHRVMALMAYGDGWRQQRRLLHQHFRQPAVAHYDVHIRKGARTLVRLLLESPEKFLRHIRHVTGATTLDVVYAMDIPREGDARMESVEKAVDVFAQIADNRGFLVDYIPALKYLPAWFPGGGFKRQAARWKKSVDYMYEAPFEEVKQNIKIGKAKPCMATDLMAAYPEWSEDPDVEESIIRVTGSAFAGSDTTVYTMICFVQVMLLFPNVQRKAQAELDEVVGKGRLPDTTDPTALPYTSALIKELLRWCPIIPLATPHMTSKDDWYNGYFIPAGCIAVGNSWSVLHNEEVYPDPGAFKPERFLTPEGTLDATVPDPMAAFGFGRRICPGRHFALAALFQDIVHVLAVFNVEKPLDRDGNVVEPKPEWTSRLFRVPKPFKARFEPRFEGAAGLLQTAGAAAH